VIPAQGVERLGAPALAVVLAVVLAVMLASGGWVDVPCGSQY
jgi:hypothetical protein